MYFYKIVEMRDLFLERTSYGILAKRTEKGVTEDFALIPGISCDREFVQHLVELCERNQLSPIHLLDVVMDALS